MQYRDIKQNKQVFFRFPKKSQYDFFYFVFFKKKEGSLCKQVHATFIFIRCIYFRYCPNVLPPMKESDLESHIMEVKEFQERLRGSVMETQDSQQGLKRSADEQLTGQKPNYYCYYRSSKTYPNPTTFH